MLATVEAKGYTTEEAERLITTARAVARIGYGGMVYRLAM
jgi:hypothetical protein